MVFNAVRYVEIDVFEWFWEDFLFQTKAKKVSCLNCFLYGFNGFLCDFQWHFL